MRTQLSNPLSISSSLAKPSERRLPWWSGHAALIVAFWSIVTVQSIAWRYSRTQLNPRPLPLSFIAEVEVIMFTIAAVLTPGIIWLTRRVPPSREHWARAAAVHLGGGALFALTVKFLWDLAIFPLYPVRWIESFQWDFFIRSLFDGFQTNVLLYFIVVIAVTAIDQTMRYHKTAVEAAELRAELAEARIEALRMQLDPHFLFNTLHTISELVHVDAGTAELMIANLSELLRRTLDHRAHYEIPLREELEFLRLYLEIQCKRFEGKISVHYEIGHNMDRAMVPSMILQPIVENSIRHAIAKRLKGGAVRIAAIKVQDRIVLEVEDSGGKAPLLPLAEGLGLRTTRERLSRMYGGAGTIEYVSAPEGLLARVALPFHPEDSHAAAQALSRSDR